MTNWNSLDGMDLRRAVLEALGWKWKRDQQFIVATGQKIGAPWRWLVDPDSVFRNIADADGTEEIRQQPDSLPPIESSADISERVLDEECRKRGYQNATFMLRDGASVQCRTTVRNNEYDVIVDATGATKSLARARAIGMLLERDAK